MPWHVPEDLAHFKRVTMGAPVLMGRRTWESLPPRFRPLPCRENIVVTRQPAWASPGAVAAASLEDGLARAAASGAEWVWLIGGGDLFAQAIARADRLEVTDLDLDVPGDTFAPALDGWHVIAADPRGTAGPTGEGWRTSRGGIRYRFTRYER